VLTVLLGRLSEEEQGEVELLREGVRKTSTWARKMGIADLESQRQKRLVHNEKVRLRRKLQRVARELDLLGEVFLADGGRLSAAARIARRKQG